MFKNLCVLFVLVAMVAWSCADDGSSVDGDGTGSEQSSEEKTDGDSEKSNEGTGTNGGSDSEDLCAADDNDAASTLECNGDIPGVQEDGELGGGCTEDDDCPKGAECLTDGDACGVCLMPCDKADTYVSTGDCSDGFRCVEWSDDESFCFPDCKKDSQCASGVCTEDGVCGLGECG